MFMSAICCKCGVDPRCGLRSGNMRDGGMCMENGKAKFRVAYLNGCAALTRAGK